MHLLLVAALLGASEATVHRMSPDSPGSTTPGWSKTNDEYGSDSPILISPVHQYLMAEIGTVAGQLGGVALGIGLLRGVEFMNGGELSENFDPFLMVAPIVATGSILGTTIATASFRPTQNKRSPLPAAMGAATGLLAGFGLGYAFKDDRSRSDDYLLIWATTSIASSLGAVIGDAMAEDSPNRSPKSSVFKPISLSPFVTPKRQAGLSISFPANL